jgi:hypothetical protein
MTTRPGSRMPVRLAAVMLGLTACALGAAPVRAAADSATDAAPAPAQAQWKKQQLRFDFTGFTTAYSCYGIEDKVRSILLEFGAAPDAKVQATGCPAGPDRPSKMIWVSADFSALAPLSEAEAAAAKPADVVKVQWVKVELSPNRPSYMGQGECELVDNMHDLLNKGFVLHNADYHTSCMPHQITLGDYHVHAEVMKPLAGK